MGYATWRATWIALAAIAALAIAAPSAVGAAEPAAAEALQLSLERCIELGIEHSVQFLTEEENFILQQLATALERHNYGALWSSTVSGTTDSADTTDEAASVTLARRLLTGGQLELSAGSSGSQPTGDDDAYSSSVSLSIDQPLLRGAGRLVAREDLTQAERELVYAGRDLILFKQEFLISLVRQYYGLIGQREQIRNQEQKRDGAEWLRDRTQALKQRGTASEIDALRAENNLLRAQNDLNDAREAYKLQIDNFKLDLGLPMEREVVIVEQPVSVKPVTPELAPSIETALETRLDLKTARDVVQDAHRALRIARNNLRGDLDLTAEVGYTSEPATSYSAQDLGQPEWSVGLSYALPLDRASEKTGYRQRLIAYARATRQAARAQDQVILDVRSTVRDLARARATIDFQEKNRDLAALRLERAQADLELTKATTRDVEEAQDALLEAQNALVRAQVDYIIATLQLEKDTGRLDPERWREWIR
jgi:outer membrane protein TolC